MLFSEQATNQTTNQITKPALTLDELLACHDQQFICCAYQTLLGRSPDVEGFHFYRRQLSAGFSKMHILRQLRFSKESKAHAFRLRGLDKAIQHYQRGQYPLIGWLFRKLYNVEGNHPTERKLRAIEQQIFLIRDENRYFRQQMAAPGSAVSDNIDSSVPDSSVSAFSPPAEPDLKQLTSRAKDIYSQLKMAAAVHARRTT